VTRHSRLAATIALVFGTLTLLAVNALPASAHPLGNFTVNRYSGLDLSPGRVRVQYVLDLAEIPTYQETPNLDSDGDGRVSTTEGQAWADRTARAILAHVVLSVDGRPVAMTVVSDGVGFRPGQAGLPILRLEIVFAGPLSSRSGSLRYQDRNDPGRIGWKEITARAEPGLSLIGSSVPAASVSMELHAYPTDMLSSPLGVTRAELSFLPGTGTAGAVARSHGPTEAGAPVAGGGAFASLVQRRLTPFVLILSVGLAFAFGALHALGPGHGKTITAAYLVGAGARRAQAIAVGLAVSVMHTASVVALGLVVLVLARTFPAERIYPWLELVTGLVALGLGLGLLIVRIRARRHGRDPWGHGHAHPHPHGHEHRPVGSDMAGDHPEPASRRGLLALAVAGGVLPSPTAFVVLLGSIHAHRIGYGLLLILAFSVGLAAALVAVGLFALRARTLVWRRMGGRWGSLVPIGSAAVIVGFGLFFATRGTVRLV
jgi:nickel/cobalt exporter